MVLPYPLGGNHVYPFPSQIQLWNLQIENHICVVHPRHFFKRPLRTYRMEKKKKNGDLFEYLLQPNNYKDHHNKRTRLWWRNLIYIEVTWHRLLWKKNSVNYINNILLMKLKDWNKGSKKPLIWMPSVSLVAVR